MRVCLELDEQPVCVRIGHQSSWPLSTRPVSTPCAVRICSYSRGALAGQAPDPCAHICFSSLSSGKLPFAKAPPDDRGLPDMHLALYDDVVVFDHATKLAYVIAWVHLARHSSVDEVTTHCPKP